MFLQCFEGFATRKFIKHQSKIVTNLSGSKSGSWTPFLEAFGPKLVHKNRPRRGPRHKKNICKTTEKQTTFLTKAWPILNPAFTVGWRILLGFWALLQCLKPATCQLPTASHSSPGGQRPKASAARWTSCASATAAGAAESCPQSKTQAEPREACQDPDGQLRQSPRCALGRRSSLRSRIRTGHCHRGAGRCSRSLGHELLSNRLLGPQVARDATQCKHQSDEGPVARRYHPLRCTWAPRGYLSRSWDR